MEKKGSPKAGYLLAGAIGAFAGALLIGIAGRAIPLMMSRLMQNMMSQMSGEGCDPEEM
jgi:hypothetical protein